MTHKNFPLALELDGEPVGKYAPYFLVGIANGRYFGGGMHLAPHAQLNDGLFDVVLVGDLTIPEKVHFVLKLYKGQIGDLEKVRFLRGTRLKISSKERIFIDADGELAGTSDAVFELLPSAVRLVKTTAADS